MIHSKATTDYIRIMNESWLVMVKVRGNFLEDDLEKTYLDYMQEAV